jgi:hypothetical protein
MRNIFVSIFSFWMLVPLSGFSQEDSLNKGLRIGLDISRYGRLIADQGYLRNEVSLDLRMKNNRFLVLNLGSVSGRLEQASYTMAATGAYARIGLDKNFINHPDDVLSLGTRIGFSSFSLKPSNVLFVDPFWGPVSQDVSRERMVAVWGEVVFGIKTQVFRNVFLGWSGSARVMFRKPRSEYFPSPEVPGYGSLEGSVSPGFQFYVSYRIPF